MQNCVRSFPFLGCGSCRLVCVGRLYTVIAAWLSSQVLDLVDCLRPPRVPGPEIFPGIQPSFSRYRAKKRARRSGPLVSVGSKPVPRLAALRRRLGDEPDFAHTTALQDGK